MPVPPLISTYSPPPLRRGDRSTCLYRDAEVIITGMHSGRIPWPRAGPWTAAAAAACSWTRRCSGRSGRNPDALRIIPEAIAFVKAFFEADKPVAAICHGPWTVLEAGAARGRTMTSWPSLQTDLKSAGAEWVDEEVVVDGNLITSRKPDDIPAFNREILCLPAGRSLTCSTSIFSLGTASRLSLTTRTARLRR